MENFLLTNASSSHSHGQQDLCCDAFNKWKYYGPLRNSLPKLFAEKYGDVKRCLDSALLEGRCTTTASRGLVLNSEENDTTF